MDLYSIFSVRVLLFKCTCTPDSIYVLKFSVYVSSTCTVSYAIFFFCKFSYATLANIGLLRSTQIDISEVWHFASSILLPQEKKIHLFWHETDFVVNWAFSQFSILVSVPNLCVSIPRESHFDIDWFWWVDVLGSVVHKATNYIAGFVFLLLFL